jgi:CDP-paratose 2-epimerase
MKVLVTGACGFAGSTLIRTWVEAGTHAVIGLDTLVRPGSERNRAVLRELGVPLHHADLRSAADLDALPAVDAVVDAAANPSVLAGVDGRVSSRQLMEHNLIGTINLLEYCRHHRASLVMLSTSRVYSARALASLRVRADGDAFRPDTDHPLPPGLTLRGVEESFSTEPPLSLYGTSKLASEQVAIEYGAAFDFPVWINRCGVLAGAGQFGRPDQGIFAFWIHSWLRKSPLAYIGYAGSGLQVRDCLHPADLAPLIDRQLAHDGPPDSGRVLNVGGGAESARSLKQVSAWCRERLGGRPVAIDPEARRFDIPWLVLDTTRAQARWNWTPRRTTEEIFDEILAHAVAHPEWLEISRSI